MKRYTQAAVREQQLEDLVRRNPGLMFARRGSLNSDSLPA